MLENKSDSANQVIAPISAACARHSIFADQLTCLRYMVCSEVVCRTALSPFLSEILFIRNIPHNTFTVLPQGFLVLYVKIVQRDTDQLHTQNVTVVHCVTSCQSDSLIKKNLKYFQYQDSCTPECRT